MSTEAFCKCSCWLGPTVVHPMGPPHDLIGGRTASWHRRPLGPGPRGAKMELTPIASSQSLEPVSARRHSCLPLKHPSFSPQRAAPTDILQIQVGSSRSCRGPSCCRQVSYHKLSGERAAQVTGWAPRPLLASFLSPGGEESRPVHSACLWGPHTNAGLNWALQQHTQQGHRMTPLQAAAQGPCRCQPAPLSPVVLGHTGRK